jgi:hypothetical protein
MKNKEKKDRTLTYSHQLPEDKNARIANGENIKEYVKGHLKKGKVVTKRVKCVKISNYLRINF